MVLSSVDLASCHRSESFCPPGVLGWLHFITTFPHSTENGSDMYGCFRARGIQSYTCKRWNGRFYLLWGIVATIGPPASLIVSFQTVPIKTRPPVLQCSSSCIIGTKGPIKSLQLIWLHVLDCGRTWNRENMQAWYIKVISMETLWLNPSSPVCLSRSGLMICDIITRLNITRVDIMRNSWSVRSDSSGSLVLSSSLFREKKNLPWVWGWNPGREPFLILLSLFLSPSGSSPAKSGYSVHVLHIYTYMSFYNWLWLLSLARIPVSLLARV